MQWNEWNIEKRLLLLDVLYINYRYEKGSTRNTLYLEHVLSSGQQEVFRFVIDPTYPVKFYLLDNNYGRHTLKLFNEFWSWRFGNED
jgi:hypothetical protein